MAPAVRAADVLFDAGKHGMAGNADLPAPATAVWRNCASTPATPPSVLGNVKNTLFVSEGAGGTALEWDDASGATGCRAYRGTTADFVTGNPAPWATSSACGIVDAETPATVFFHVVHATDGISESAE